MYCTNCGNKIDNKNDNFCTNCGVRLEKLDNDLANVSSVSSNNVNGINIVAIILGVLGIMGSLTFVFAPMSLILSIIGLVLGFSILKKEKNFIPLLITSIGTVLSLIVTVILIFICVNIINMVNDKSIPWYDEIYHNYYERF